jgi:hypothetical protein
MCCCMAHFRGKRRARIKWPRGCGAMAMVCSPVVAARQLGALRIGLLLLDAGLALRSSLSLLDGSAWADLGNSEWLCMGEFRQVYQAWSSTIQICLQGMNMMMALQPARVMIWFSDTPNGLPTSCWRVALPLTEQQPAIATRRSGQVSTRHWHAPARAKRSVFARTTNMPVRL